MRTRLWAVTVLQAGILLIQAGHPMSPHMGMRPLTRHCAINHVSALEGPELAESKGQSSRCVSHGTYNMPTNRRSRLLKRVQRPGSSPCPLSRIRRSPSQPLDVEGTPFLLPRALGSNTSLSLASSIHDPVPTCH